MNFSSNILRNLFAFFGSILVALMSLKVIPAAHPFSSDNWEISENAITLIRNFGVIFFIPYVFLLWAIFAPVKWQQKSFIWLRRLSFILIICIGSLVLGLDLWILLGYTFRSIVEMVFAALITLIFAPSGNYLPALVLYRRCLLIFFFVGIIAIFGWSFINIALVSRQAEVIAQGRPYCLQVPGPDYRYKPVKSLFDLAGLKMRASMRHDLYWEFHAVLIVQKPSRETQELNKSDFEWFNWSYWSQNFLPTNSQHKGYPQTCEVRASFVRHLPW